MRTAASSASETLMPVGYAFSSNSAMNYPVASCEVSQGRALSVRHHGFSRSSLYKVTSKQAPRNLLIECVQRCGDLWMRRSDSDATTTQRAEDLRIRLEEAAHRLDLQIRRGRFLTTPDKG